MAAGSLTLFARPDANEQHHLPGVQLHVPHGATGGHVRAEVARLVGIAPDSFDLLLFGRPVHDATPLDVPDRSTVTWKLRPAGGASSAAASDSSAPGAGGAAAAAGGHTEDNGEDDMGECAICLESFVPGYPPVKLACSHGFHRPCLTQWRLRSQHCPLCRRVMVEAEAEGSGRPAAASKADAAAAAAAAAAAPAGSGASGSRTSAGSGRAAAGAVVPSAPPSWDELGRLLDSVRKSLPGAEDVALMLAAVDSYRSFRRTAAGRLVESAALSVGRSMLDSVLDRSPIVGGVARILGYKTREEERRIASAGRAGGAAAAAGAATGAAVASGLAASSRQAAIARGGAGGASCAAAGGRGEAPAPAPRPGGSGAAAAGGGGSGSVGGSGGGTGDAAARPSGGGEGSGFSTGAALAIAAFVGYSLLRKS